MSTFLRQLKKLLTAPMGDEVWLCSGFFADHILNNNEILDGALRSSDAPKEIVLVGGMFRGDPDNRTYFKNLRKRFEAEYSLKTRAYAAKSNKWHGKIAVRVDGMVPVAAIIGSSNLSQPAVKDGHDPWNHESDVTIWVDELDSHFRPRDRDVAPDEYALLLFDPDEEHKEKRRLEDLFSLLQSLIEDEVLIPDDDTGPKDDDELDIENIGK